MINKRFDLDELRFEIAIGSHNRSRIEEGLTHLGYRRMPGNKETPGCVELWTDKNQTTPTLFIADEEPLLRYEVAILRPGQDAQELITTREQALGSLPYEPLYTLTPAAVVGGLIYLATSLLPHATNAEQLAYTLGATLAGGAVGTLAAKLRRNTLAEQAERRLDEMTTLYHRETPEALRHVFGLPSYSSRLRKNTDPGIPSKGSQPVQG